MRRRPSPKLRRGEKTEMKHSTRPTMNTLRRLLRHKQKKKRRRREAVIIVTSLKREAEAAKIGVKIATATRIARNPAERKTKEERNATVTVTRITIKTIMRRMNTEKGVTGGIRRMTRTVNGIAIDGKRRKPAVTNVNVGRRIEIGAKETVTAIGAKRRERRTLEVVKIGRIAVEMMLLPANKKPTEKISRT